MKILLIDVNYKQSSSGKIVYELFNAINSHGHEAVVCYGRGEGVAEKKVYKFGIDIETIFHAILSRLTGLNGFFSFFSTMRLIKYIENFDPDIVHIHELHGYFVNIYQMLRYLRKKEKKIIWTFHCEYMYTGKCGISNNCSKWKVGCGNCKNLRNYPRSFFLDFTRFMYRIKKESMNEADVEIVCPSEWLANRVKESFLKDKRVSVIHNGIDINVFYPRKNISELKKKLGVNEKNYIVLFVSANLHDLNKGFHWVLALAKKLEEFPITFVVLGDSTKLNDTKNIEFHGLIKNSNTLAEYYSLADTFLLCSQTETFSLTCAEALACGANVVGYEAGAPETIFKQPNVEFVRYGDIRGLEKALINNCINKDKCLKNYSYAHKARYDFSNETMIEKYMELYKKCT